MFIRLTSGIPLSVDQFHCSSQTRTIVTFYLLLHLCQSNSSALSEISRGKALMHGICSVIEGFSWPQWLQRRSHSTYIRLHWSIFNRSGHSFRILIIQKIQRFLCIVIRSVPRMDTFDYIKHKTIIPQMQELTSSISNSLITTQNVLISQLLNFIEIMILSVQGESEYFISFI